MTMLPIYKICPKCRRRFCWSPDTGTIVCPRCNSKKDTVSDGIKALSSLFKK